MKNIKKSLAILLALSFVFSMFSFNVFAGDEIESPIIPINPSASEWYKYSLDADAKTAVLIGFNESPSRTKITIRSTYEKDGVKYSVIGVDKDVFKGKEIQTLVIEEGVEFIAEGAFADCAKLTSVQFADSLVSVDSTAFDGSKWLADQPDGLIYAGKIAYKMKGTSPASVTLAADTASIADNAFAGQTTLEKIFIPKDTAIGEDAFAGCTAVTIYCAENSLAAAYAAAEEINVVFVPKLLFVTEPAKKEYYQGDVINLNGAELLYLSEEGETAVELASAEITGFDTATLGTKTVTLAYNGSSVSFDITVLERPAFIPGDVDADGEVDLDDAIYLLYHVNFSDTYPVNQPVDFNGDSKEDLDDAIYLLYHVNFSGAYPLH